MPADEHEANRETARQIESHHPGWMVLWGVYSKQYVAFPLFAAPPGTILTAGYSPALAARMAAVERRVQGTRGHRSR
jgi:hypothetical protein